VNQKSLKKFIFVTIMAGLLAGLPACSKGSNSSAASSGSGGGGSGLDGTGVFIYNGTLTTITDITASGTGGAQTLTPSGGIPATAKFMLLTVEYTVAAGTSQYQSSGQAYFDLKVDDDTASTVNEAGIHSASAAIPGSSSLTQSHNLVVPLHVTSLYDFRGKPSLKFYQGSGTTLSANTKITVYFGGFVY
jgi:hypothetical protein